MKNLLILTSVVLASLSIINPAKACYSAIENRTFLVVNSPGVKVAEAQTGDVLEITQRAGALVPGNHKSVQFEVEGAQSMIVTDGSLPELGVVGKMLLVKFVDPGVVTIKIHILDDGKLIETIEQKVKVTQRPRTRC